jgi:hypothetical protein
MGPADFHLEHPILVQPAVGTRTRGADQQWRWRHAGARRAINQKVISWGWSHMADIVLINPRFEISYWGLEVSNRPSS